MKNLSIVFVVIALAITSCTKEEPLSEQNATDNSGQPEASECDASFNPVVMCHGLLASGDTYAGQVKRFVQNGYCPSHLRVLDWNTLGGGSAVNQLDEYIDGILAGTGATQVELVGHSAGGGLGYDYLNDPTRAAKVSHYVHIGSNPESGPAGPNGEVATLNIYSPYDAVVEGDDIPGATNVSLTLKDHYEVATSEESFTEMFTFFRDVAPNSAAIQPDGIRAIGGVVLTLGENDPLEGAAVNVFEVNSATGERLAAEPLVTYVTNNYGQWGCFNAEENTHYEFEVISADPADRKLHYYREPFITSDNLVYLRAFPPPLSLAGTLLASLPEDDGQAVVISFTASQAVINNRDEMTVEGYNLSTQEFADEENTTIAYFLYDDGDQQTEEESVGLFGLTPFLTGVDVFFPTDQQETINLVFNQREVNVPSWPSESEGVTIVVFD